MFIIIPMSLPIHFLWSDPNPSNPFLIQIILLDGESKAEPGMILAIRTPIYASCLSIVLYVYFNIWATPSSHPYLSFGFSFGFSISGSWKIDENSMETPIKISESYPLLSNSKEPRQDCWITGKALPTMKKPLTDGQKSGRMGLRTWVFFGWSKGRNRPRWWKNHGMEKPWKKLWKMKLQKHFLSITMEYFVWNAGPDIKVLIAGKVRVQKGPVHPHHKDSNSCYATFVLPCYQGPQATNSFWSWHRSFETLSISINYI